MPKKHSSTGRNRVPLAPVAVVFEEIEPGSRRAIRNDEGMTGGSLDMIYSLRLMMEAPLPPIQSLSFTALTSDDLINLNIIDAAEAGQHTRG